MIRHIFKVIWNERKANAWIVLEFFVVFCVLWFCIDYLFFAGKLFGENMGYNTDHVYRIRVEAEENGHLVDPEIHYGNTQILLDRIRQYPGVETVSASIGSIPYSNSSYRSSYWLNEDTLASDMTRRIVTPEFFKVYKIEPISGHLFTDDPTGANREVIISPLRNGMVGSYPAGNYSASEVHNIRPNDKLDYKVVGIVPKMRSFIYTQFEGNVFFPMTKERFMENRGNLEITFRVAPSADIDFEEKFNREMEETLTISPYVFRSIEPVQKEIDRDMKDIWNNYLKNILAVSIFLLANIFLGIIGTFWSRIQSRRSEIGLRIALGASKRNVKMMMFTETVLMLLCSSIVATYVCLNLGQTDFLQTFGIPTANRTTVGTGGEQDVINFLVTFLILMIISGLAIWYPARLSTNIPPAESLREE